MPMSNDLERRFGGLRRLYGDAGYVRIRQACVAVVGLGGVGSWAVEALARCGVAKLILIDLDHVSESNINRQIQATSQTLGLSKGVALQQRIVDIHPQCEVVVIEEFVEASNWPNLLADYVDLNTNDLDGWIDACDQVKAKEAMLKWYCGMVATHAANHLGSAVSMPAMVCVGAAGGKQLPTAIAANDLSEVTHDPLLASLRSKLRKQNVVPKSGQMGLRCIYSAESVQQPFKQDEACALEPNLACHGYGSSVMVTASFGMAAAAEIVRQIVQQ